MVLRGSFREVSYFVASEMEEDSTLHSNSSKLKALEA